MNRRELLKSLSALTASAALGCEPDSACGISSAQMEGPYYLDLDNAREDITEGLPGVGLSLTLVVVDAETCEPIEGAEVEVWHADADGVYSGFSEQGTEGEGWLRGRQTATADGVGFETIYPGFYSGRTSHIHVRVNAPGYDELLTQVYFPASANAEISAEYGGGDTDNSDDGLYDADNELEAVDNGDGTWSASGSLALWLS